MQFPHWSTIHTIIFDFDGIFTDNSVYVDEHGNESVKCSRADGLAFEMLRQFVKLNNWQLSYFILSTEANPVVSIRAAKLKIPCVQASMDKLSYITKYLTANNIPSSGVVYLGNDLNDLPAMMLPGIVTVAPADAHERILSSASTVLPQKGGHGFVRTFLESLLGLDSMSYDQLVRVITRQD